jgi:hypothetical protein
MRSLIELRVPKMLKRSASLSDCIVIQASSFQVLCYAKANRGGAMQVNRFELSKLLLSPEFP